MNTHEICYNILIFSVSWMVFLGDSIFELDEGGWRDDRARQVFREIGNAEDFSSVGQFLDSDRASSGSAVLIAREWVLTAGHVVDRWDRPMDYQFSIGEQTYRAKEIILHPDYRLSSDPGRVDMALVRIERTDEDIALAFLYTDSGELDKRAALVGFRYAQPDNTLGANQTPPGMKYGGFNVIDSVSVNYLKADFDSPHTTDLNVMGSAVPDSLEYIPLGGDSGSGVFILGPEGWELAAVICGGIRFTMDHLGKHGWYRLDFRLTRVSTKLEWIRETIR